MTKRILFILLVVCAMSKHTQQQFNPQFNPQQMPGQQQQQQQQLPGQNIGFNSQFQSQQSSGTGNLQQTIYQFLKTLPQASKFVQSMDLIAQQLQDRSVLSILNGEQTLQTLYPGTAVSSTGVTVFVPINDAFNNMPSDAKSLKNQLYNFVVQDRLNLDRLRDLSGSNLTSTFGIMPRLYLRTVRNFYRRQLNPAVSQQQPQQQQYNPQQPGQQQLYPQQQGSNMQFPSGQQQPNQQPNQQFPQNSPNQQVPSFQANQPAFNQNQQWNQQGSSSYLNNSNIYNQMSYLFQNGQNGQNTYNGPPISVEFPQDELFLLNDAILLEKYEVSNGIIYLMSSNPRYYDQTAWSVMTSGGVNGLTQNTNFWITQATQARRLGNDNLYLSFRVADQNTYFLPSDAAFSKYLNRDSLANSTFLYEVIFKSHRISGQVLFDYYLDSPNVYYTDTLLPVSTVHRRLSGSNVDDIEISIGHVKGKLNPDLRNIYCSSGIIHVVDTVLGVPQMSAYQKIMLMPELSTFRQLVDRSSKYRQLLDQSPTQIQYPTQPPNMYRSAQIRSQRNKAKRQNVNPFNQLNQQQQQQQLQYQQQQQYGGSGGYRYGDMSLMTILAPNEAGLLAVRDYLMQNDTALDQFLSSHIIVDNEQNRVFYTDLDQNIFQTGQRYTTLNPVVFLTATIQRLDTDSRNRVALQVQGLNGIQSRIVDGDERVSNGVIQIIDRPLMQFSTPDLMSVLDKYATSAGSGTASGASAAINNFYDALKATGIYNELKSSPYKQFTLFVPTNDALQRYMSIVNSNDMTQRRQMVQSHISVMNEVANGTETLANDNLFDINRQFKLENNEVIRIEVPYDGELKDHYIVYKHDMIKILGEYYASNGRLFIIDSILTKDGHLARIAGIHDTNTPFSHAYEPTNTSSKHVANNILYTLSSIFVFISVFYNARGF